MWRLFKKRQEDDLRRLVSAYRCFLKAASQAEESVLLDEDQREAQRWKGGFGKAINQLFHEWPTLSQSKNFEKIMQRRLKKAREMDQAYILAFNKYLSQKRLSAEELKEVLILGQQMFKGVN